MWFHFDVDSSISSKLFAEDQSRLDILWYGWMTDLNMDGVLLHFKKKEEPAGLECSGGRKCLALNLSFKVLVHSRSSILGSWRSRITSATFGSTAEKPRLEKASSQIRSSSITYKT